MATTEPKQKPAHAQHKEGCPILMHERRRCGRPIYDALKGVDKEPVCLMHSHDLEKDNAAFQEEFERILAEASRDKGVADFFGFVFLRSNYRGRQFKPQCIFYRATFTQDADFHGVTFTQDAEFSEAAFMQDADFHGVTFTQGAYFSGATFTQDADFSGATFTQFASFLEATFTRDADFRLATFTQAANFTHATFAKSAVFYNAKFLGRVEFRESVFRSDETLEPGPVFSRTEFQKPKEVTFYKTNLGQALFHNCDVSEVHFSDVTWRKRQGSGKSMVFDEEVEFETENLCNEALQPKEGDPNQRNYRLVAELYQQLKKYYDDRRDYWTAGDFHYGEMEMKRLGMPQAGWLARRLERMVANKNYVKTFRRWRLKRLIMKKSHVTEVRRWWHQRMGLAAWYKRASEYGENYVRPVLWMGVVLAAFTLAYPIAGLRLSEAARKSSAVGAIHESPLRDPATAQATSPPGVSEVSYRRFFEIVSKQPYGRVRGTLAFFGHSLVTALYVAAFQKDLVYEPSYPSGRVLALAEVVLTSTLIALFLLAVRRQFRR